VFQSEYGAVGSQVPPDDVSVDSSVVDNRPATWQWKWYCIVTQYAEADKSYQQVTVVQEKITTSNHPPYSEGEMATMCPQLFVSHDKVAFSW